MVPCNRYIETVEWTRAANGEMGRHGCAPADAAGVHFNTGTANTAHIQQVCQHHVTGLVVVVVVVVAIVVVAVVARVRIVAHLQVPLGKSVHVGGG